MTISMYQASVPRFVNILGNLSNILDKAQAHIDARKIDASVLTGYRLFPDMLPMTRQVQIACDAAKGVVARLAGLEIPPYEDDEKTLADLKARIAKTVAFIQTVTPKQIDGTDRWCPARGLARARGVSWEESTASRRGLIRLSRIE